MTSEPLAQLSPDVSLSSRPRLRWSSNDPQLSRYRETRGAAREERAQPTRTDETGVWGELRPQPWGEHGHVCDHVCEETACAQDFMSELRCMTATVCVGQ